MTAKKVIFWQKVPKPVQRDDKDNRVTEFELVACEAEVIGKSEKVCGICGDPERSHGKSKRRHGFSNPVTDLSLKVTYAGGRAAGQTVELHNVQEGEEANCWAKKE